MLNQLKTSNPEEIKRQMAGEKTATDEEATITGNPRFRRRYEFDIEYTAANGEQFNGTFVNKVLNFEDQANVGAMRSAMQQGLPIESFDEVTVTRNAKIAHMTYSLVERPDWAKSLGKLDCANLLDLLWKEVQDHESTFHGPRVEEAAGASTGKDD